MTPSRSSEPSLDPEVASDLAELDRALTGEPGASPELLTLVADVRALSLPPRGPARAALDRQVAEGFGSRRRRERRERRRRLLGPLALGAGALACLVVIAGLVLSRPEHDVDRSGAGSTAASEASGASSAAAPAPGGAAAAGPRRIERTAELTLSVGRGGVAAAADGVLRAARAVGGYAAESQVSTSGARGSADLRLRVPSARLDDIIARLGRLGRITGLDQDARDITGTFDAAAARLAEARAERTRLLRALAGAQTDEQARVARARLTDQRRVLERREQAAAQVRRRAQLATLQVSVRTRAAGAAVADGPGRFGPGTALRSARRALEVASGVAVLALAVLLPFGVVVGLLLGAGAALRRGRRRRALGLA